MSANEEAWRSAPPPAVQPQRDVASAIGEPLYRGVMTLWRIPFGFILLLAGWGISVPAYILYRTSMSQVLRLALAALVFAAWVALIVSEAVA
jgi:hypothetical protein